MTGEDWLLAVGIGAIGGLVIGAIIALGVLIASVCA